MFGELSRRNFLALGASAGIGLGLGSISTSALAKAAKLRVQAPYSGTCCKGCLEEGQISRKTRDRREVTLSLKLTIVTSQTNRAR